MTHQKSIEKILKNNTPYKKLFDIPVPSRDVTYQRREIITVRGQSYVSRLPKYIQGDKLGQTLCTHSKQ
jgi:hypothetical protein